MGTIEHVFAPLDREIEDLAQKVIGAAIQVHKTLGPGFMESVYEESICIELQKRGTPFQRQHSVSLLYEGVRVGEARIDLLVDRRLIVELKAVEDLVKVHTAQTISYLRAANLRLGLLINFNVPVLKDGIKRIIL